jgi:hypothetical protein
MVNSSCEARKLHLQEQLHTDVALHPCALNYATFEYQAVTGSKLVAVLLSP